MLEYFGCCEESGVRVNPVDRNPGLPCSDEKPCSNVLVQGAVNLEVEGPDLGPGPALN